MATPTIYNYKPLAGGQLPATITTLYTVPATKETAVQTIAVSNTGAGVNTVKIYVNLTGSSIRIVCVDLDPDDTLYLDSVGTLEAGDLIEGEATNAAECDYYISGAEAAP